jgi:hypothetical protein
VDTRRAIDWLTSTQLRHETGHCLSWVGPRGDGYPPSDRRVHSLVNALAQTSFAPEGLGRAGVSYTFDTAIGIRGILAASERPETLASLLAPWVRLVVERIKSGSAVNRSASSQPRRWSNQFGPHQLKISGALIEYAGSGKACPEVNDAFSAVDALLDRCLPLQMDDGRFIEFHGSTETYTHAHCYAIEGLLMAADAGWNTRTPALRATEWLARCQTASGGLRARHDGGNLSGPYRIDATAQAVRLWRLVDPAGFKPAIEAATEWLESLVLPSGAMPYEPAEFPDQNSWATMFTVQALAQETPLFLSHSRQLA